ncbi:MAG: HAD-IA family hydrolase [Clostridiales bacterium]|nr:HAD-IA family hydrolase [Clostridiales bacterium]
MKDIFLLDMDDTLFDFRRTEEINFCQTLAKFGISAKKQAFERFRDINIGLWQEFERGETTKEQIKLMRFSKLFNELGIIADVPKVAYSYVENFKEICITFDGADGFLKELLSLGKIYIVTNGNTDIQMRHLTDAGFLPFIEQTFISDEIGSAKPSKEFAEHLKTHIKGFERGHAVWIGDSLTSDKACAEIAGVDFILYAPHGVPQNYNGLCATNYAEVMQILNKL